MFHSWERKRLAESEGAEAPDQAALAKAEDYVAGARWAQGDVLYNHPDADLRVIAVWFDMVRSGNRARARSNT